MFLCLVYKALMENHHHRQLDQNLCAKMEKFPRDLLQGFAVSSGGSEDSTAPHHHQNQHPHHQNQRGGGDGEEGEEEEEVELNLGLSLGGRFGVDKHAKKKKLMRSSSVVGTMPLFREDDAVAPPPATYPTLMRTSSLPTETEEEWRRRKELQTLRRMEAKRRRSEKQRVSKEVGSGGGGGGSEEVVEGGGSAAMGLNRLGSSATVPPPFGWGVGTKQVVLGDVIGKGRGVGFQGLFTQPSSQGSADSQGGSSSSISEMESKPFLGPSSCVEPKSPASHDAVGGSSRPKTNENVTRTPRAEVNNPTRTHHAAAQNMVGREFGTNSMEDMPCVFAKGDGPNGRRIEGILYKYGKGEEVRIMCVCHGNFLSPAEFVRHAGGGDVEHPLRHIVVNPSAAPFL